MSQISAPHGTEARYQHGCRCPRCRQANAIASRAKRERRKLAAAGMLDPPPAHLRRPPASPGEDPARQEGRTQPNSAPPRSGARGQPRAALRPAQPRAAASASAALTGKAIPRGSRPASAPGRLAQLPAPDGRLAAGPPAAGTEAGPAPRRCRARGCFEPGVHEIDTAAPTAEMISAAGGSLPALLCGRHSAALQRQWPADWRELGVLPSRPGI